MAAMTAATALMKRAVVRNSPSSCFSAELAESLVAGNVVRNRARFSPGDFRRCDFEEGLCDWDLRSLSSLKWIITNQEGISTTDPRKGPGRDQSKNSASGIPALALTFFTTALSQKKYECFHNHDRLLPVCDRPG